MSWQVSIAKLHEGIGAVVSVGWKGFEALTSGGMSSCEAGLLDLHRRLLSLV